VATSPRACRASRRCVERGECFHNPVHARCDDGRDRLSDPLWISGIVHVGLGGLGLIGGALLGFCGAYAGSFDHPSGPPAPDCSDEHLAAPIVASIGSLSLNAGIVMLVVGLVDVTREPSTAATPDLVVMPGAATLRWAF
jgi:hypothetical protein